MIEMNNVTKIYKMGTEKVYAIRDVNLHVEDAGFLALTGPSGSGKSTLLYAVGALLTPTEGEVIVDGASIYKMTTRERAKFRRNNIGFVFQTFELIPYLTALENVILPMYLSGAAKTKHRELAFEALSQVGLTERATHKPSELSGGEQQRVSIARGIVNNPSIILADEPTGNLDRETGNEVVQLLQRLNEEEEMTVVMVTHDQSKTRFAKKILTIIDGSIVENMSGKTLKR